MSCLLYSEWAKKQVAAYPGSLLMREHGYEAKTQPARSEPLRKVAMTNYHT